MSDEYCVLLVRRKDGTAEVDGKEYVLVPREPARKMLKAMSNATYLNDGSNLEMHRRYNAMLSAAAIDLSGLPEAPIFDVMRRNGK